MQVPLLYEVRFNNVFKRFSVFADGGRQVVNAYRSAIELFDNSQKEFPVNHVKAERIHVKHLQRLIGNFASHGAVGADLGKVPDATQEAVSDAGRTAAAACYFIGAFGINLDIEQPRAAVDDFSQVFRFIKL